MKAYKVEITLGINAMNDESAENKLETFLSALDLKKNDKLELIEMGELTEGGKSPESKSTAEKTRPKIEYDDDDDDDDDEEDWDDSWADEDWDSIDEDEDEDEESEESEESEEL